MIKKMVSLLRRCREFLFSNKAVSTLEYAILAGVVVAGVGAAIVTFSQDIATAITDLGGEIKTGVETANPDKAKLTP